MLFETIATNAAAILTILLMWCTVVWIITYVYMAEKVRIRDEKIEFLDIYIEEMEAHYGHVIDDYIDMYYSDGEWVQS